MYDFGEFLTFTFSDSEVEAYGNSAEVYNLICNGLCRAGSQLMLAESCLKLKKFAGSQVAREVGKGDDFSYDHVIDLITWSRIAVESSSYYFVSVANILTSSIGVVNYNVFFSSFFDEAFLINSSSRLDDLLQEIRASRNRSAHAEEPYVNVCKWRKSVMDEEAYIKELRGNFSFEPEFDLFLEGKLLGVWKGRLVSYELTCTLYEEFLAIFRQICEALSSGVKEAVMAGK